jgi:putative ABC transport system ATP-binding protein
LSEHQPPIGAPCPQLLDVQCIGRRISGGTDGSQWLFRDVSLSVQGGERIGLVGPTGAGKTVLLRAISLLDPLDAGRICWCGAPLTPQAVPAFRSGVIYLHQRPAIGAGTVEDNLRQPFALKQHRERSFRKEHVIGMLMQVGRGEEFLRKPSQNLSGGERHLTSLLRAIQLEPRVLLLDEPTAALDPAATEAVERLVLEWHSQGGRAFIWVSHHAQQIQRLAGRVVALRDGRLAEENPR